MTPYAVERDISAKASRIWEILTDPKQLSDGSFSILKIDGDIVAGQTISLWSEVAPKQRFRIKVAAIGPEEMVWSSGMPLGLFRGTRRFTVRPNGVSTMFSMTETYTGPLAGRMKKMIPNLQPSFDKFADALKATAEGSR